MLTQLTKKPGEFKAFCRQARWVDVAELLAMDPLPEGAVQERWNRKTESNEALLPCAFETTDRAAYDAHMALHEPKPWESPSTGARLSTHTLPVSVPVKMWKGPTLAAAGKPLSAKVLERMKTCPTCGLVGQVDGAGGALWWREHVNGCALAQAGAAS